MSCAHPRANTRLRHGLLLHTLTDVTRVSLSQEHIDAGWSLGEAASRLHQRIDYCYYRLLKSGDSRGRQLSQDASDDAALEHTRVRASFLPARSRLVQLFSGQPGTHATEAAAPPFVAADEAAQLKRGALSSPQRAPMRSQATCLLPRTWRIAW